MIPEIKSKWIEKLRSGKYTQGTGALNENGSYCCLGVLCEVYMEETGDGKWIPVDRTNAMAFKTYNSGMHHSGFPPHAVIEWSELETENGELPESSRSQYESLADANDEGRSFKQIASLIEKHF